MFLDVLLLHLPFVLLQLLEYVGRGKSIMDVGLAQARLPLSTRCHYYELEIVDAGEKCYIALGLARRVSAPTFSFSADMAANVVTTL